MTRLQSAAHAAESVTGKFMMNLVALIFGGVLTVLTSLILVNMMGFRDTANLALKTAQAAANNNTVQDLRLSEEDAARAETKQTIGAMQGTIRVHDLQIQKNTDSIDRIDNTQKQLLQRSRPGH